eukprot:scaffold194126_cov25-Tisochrysis_lutea.AAC.1
MARLTSTSARSDSDASRCNSSSGRAARRAGRDQAVPDTSPTPEGAWPGPRRSRRPSFRFLQADVWGVHQSPAPAPSAQWRAQRPQGR